jgi:hypothetical protein
VYAFKTYSSILKEHNKNTGQNSAHGRGKVGPENDGVAATTSEYDWLELL